MRENFAAVMTAVYGHEGGYVNHPRDPGGPTKYGITAATLGAWRKLGRAASVAEVRALDRAEAERVLRAQYAAPIRFDDLPAGLDYAVFDFAVNSGPGQAAKSLQRVLGVGRDGVIGAKTLQAIAANKGPALINRYCDERLRFMQGLSTWGTFGKGWTRRVASVRSGALRMATAAFPPGPLLGNETASPVASPADTKVTATTQGKGIVTSAIGAAGTAVGAAKDAVQPLAGSGGWVDRIFMLLTVAGVILLLAGIAMSAFAETRRIATGNPV